MPGNRRVGSHAYRCKATREARYLNATFEFFDSCFKGKMEQVILLAIIGTLGTVMSACLVAIIAGIFKLLQGQQQARFAREQETANSRAALVSTAEHVAAKVDATNVSNQNEFIELKGICNGRLTELMELVAACEPLAIEAAKALIAKRHIADGKIP